MRTKNVIKNILASWLGQIVMFICNLFSRWVFLQVLSLEYLGISGLFVNILTILSFADLGLSASIAYYLYEPLANNDYNRIRQIVKCYKKIYSTIGIGVFVVGCAFIPFLPLIVGETSIENITFIYCMYIFNSSISYFNVHKATLINADQKGYITTSYTNVIKFVQVLAAICVLYITRSYICFYFVQIIATIVTNVLISRKADSLYPYLSEKMPQDGQGDIWLKIRNNMGSMSIHKFAEVIVNGTDNILVSVFVNLSAVGLYNNYLTIINCINNVVNSLFYSMSASIGNYSVSESNEKKKELFDTLIFMEFWCYGFCSICLYVLLTPFIKLIFGDGYQLTELTVFVIVLNFYIQGMRRIVLAFRNAEGLWKQDRYKAILEAVVNLVVSVVLARRYGMIGVFLGTTVSLLLSCVWLEPLILFKYAFHCSTAGYFFNYIKYLLEILGAGFITYYLCSLLESVSFISFALKAVLCAIVPNVLLLGVNWKNRYFRILLRRITHK